MDHWSDCAVHNGPDMKPGPCDCGGIRLGSRLSASLGRLVYNLAGVFGLLHLASVRRAFRLEETSSNQSAHYSHSHHEPAMHG